MITIKEISAEETYPLRHSILRPHQTLDQCKDENDYRTVTFHIGAFDQQTLISCASFCDQAHDLLSEESQYRLFNMATLPAYRKQGAGRKVIQEAENRLLPKGIKLIWCKGRTSAHAYYERLGFQAYGEPFDYPDLGSHIIMAKALKSE